MSEEPTAAGVKLVNALQEWCREQHDGQDLMIVGGYFIAEVTRVDGTSWLHNGGLDGQGAADTAAWTRIGWLECARANEIQKWNDAFEQGRGDAD